MYTKQEVIELIMCFFGFALIIAFFVGIFLGGRYLILSLPKKLCEDKYSSYTVNYQFLSGCRVRVNDKWVPVENLRQI